MKETARKCSTDQRFILKEITSYKIHTLTDHPVLYFMLFLDLTSKSHLWKFMKDVLKCFKYLHIVVFHCLKTYRANLSHGESRFFMVPNVWLMDEGNSKNNTEILKLVSPEGAVKTRLVHNNQLPLKNNSVEMVQESK